MRDDHAGRVDDMVPCSTQQYGMLWHGVWFGMAWYGMLYVVWYGMVWYGAVWCHGIYIPAESTYLPGSSTSLILDP